MAQIWESQSDFKCTLLVPWNKWQIAFLKLYICQCDYRVCIQINEAKTKTHNQYVISQQKGHRQINKCFAHTHMYTHTHTHNLIHVEQIALDCKCMRHIWQDFVHSVFEKAGKSSDLTTWVGYLTSVCMNGAWCVTISEWMNQNLFAAILRVEPLKTFLKKTIKLNIIWALQNCDGNFWLYSLNEAWIQQSVIQHCYPDPSILYCTGFKKQIAKKVFFNVMWWCHKLSVQNANITIYPTTANQNVDTDGGRSTIITILLIQYIVVNLLFLQYMIDPAL